MKKLNESEIIALHDMLIDKYGGLKGIRDRNSFSSAINSPYQTFDSKYLFPSIYQKATKLCYGIVKNHPFIVGNKRIATHSMLILLKINNIDLRYSEEELILIIFKISKNEITYENLVYWLISH